ncbi:hypothetical protein C2845_PM17G03280 [Panicum miliaceum]|uniref:DUF1618 domain-containing protein n=1 Tax=Panicum miliaceum TaxID=4540 RepID=A0A3L6Q0R0_PANMI|nr:hypothetical protein C2845_PM17G03280 [Panicum miliaceum]
MLLELWNFFPDRVVPVGDRFLCWVKYSSGILLCDMAADPNLVLRHLPLPVTPWPCGGPHHIRGYSDDEYEDDQMRCSRNMCGAGAAALRFVSVDPRCCCGGPGRSTCPRSTFAFTVTTWTMSLTTAAEGERMAWAVDGVLDCEELWALPGYEGLPRVPPECPVVSPDNPDIVCFRLSEEMVWMLEVDTRRKVLLSVVQCRPKDPYDHLAAFLVECFTTRLSRVPDHLRRFRLTHETTSHNA